MSKVVKPALLIFKFQCFGGLNSSPGKNVSYSLTDCHGRGWELNLYPGGGFGSIPGNIALSIGGVSTLQLKKYTFTLAIRNSSGDVVCELELDGSSSKEILLEKCRNVMDRSQILDKEENILINGALHVDMLVQTKSQKTDLPQPSNPLASKILALCETGTDSDISFTVQNEVINAHHFILKLNAPVLAEFFQNSTTLTINDTPADVFRVALSYVYGNCEIEDATMVNFGTDLITVADKYELLELKETVENALVRNCVVSKSNVSEYILFATSKNCPMLKEYAVSFFMLNAQDVLKSDSSLQLRESAEILTELMIAMGNKFNQVAIKDSKKS
eukprot:scaffold13379_cov23-Cyclotella_meneghiniana.AAC.3